MQAIPAWAAPGGTLGRIIAETRPRVAELKKRRRALEAGAAERAPAPSLEQALRRPDVAIIAEVKRRSPSAGEINAALSPAQRAAAYSAGGAAAISVLTEPRHFGGSADDLLAVRAAAPLPVLKKDFHIDPIQVIEARALGASAVLLIARAVDPATLTALAREAAAVGVEAFIEVRSEAELERALATGAAVIGVNSRDLETLALNFEVTERLVPLIPAARVAVAESGVHARSEVERAAQWGADAVLVGSALSAAPDPRLAVLALIGIPRASRAA